MKGIKTLRRLCACGLAVALFLMSSNSVLAADYTIVEIVTATSSSSAQELQNGDKIISSANNITVYINGIKVAENVGSYTYDGELAATANADRLRALAADPHATGGPYDLYIVNSWSDDEELPPPDEDPGEEPSSIPSTEPSEDPSEEPSSIPSETPGSVPTPTPITGNRYGHLCEYEWIVTQEPTVKEDGVLSYMCEKCQGVLKTQPITKYQAILKEIEKKITDAPKGATIELKYDFLKSLPKWILDLLDERPDLTVVVTFETDKTWYTFTIPARDQDEKLAEDGVSYYGLHYLGDKFGKKELEK